MATPNSGQNNLHLYCRLAGFSLGLLGGLGAAEPVAGSEAGTNVAARAQAIFLASQARHQEAPADLTAAWQFGRASFDWAEFATRDALRAQIAEAGVAACRKAVAGRPTEAAGHYYLGMNLGQLARTRSLGALPLVSEMERAFKTARELDERLDYAGPDRCLGLLYLDAPGWPVSVGSQSKARRHLRRAVELSPEYPENRLNLIEASLRFKDQRMVRSEVTALEALWPSARSNFVGEAWVASWSDWEKRWKVIRKQKPVPEKPPPAPAEVKYPLVTPISVTTARVVSTSPALRFVVMDFAFNPIPAAGRRFEVYRQGKRVGAVSVSGPARQNHVAADIVEGEVQPGDEARQD